MFLMRPLTYVCFIGSLFALGALAQAPSTSNNGVAGGQQASSVITEYAKFLQEEDKSHRDYLEKLYTVTSGVLAFLVAVAVGLIGYAQFRTRKDVEDAVNARFQATVDREIERRLEEFNDQLSGFERTLADLRKDAKTTENVLQKVRSRADETRAIVDAKETEPTEAEPSGRAVQPAPTPALDKDETEILRAIGNSRYSLRTKVGVIQEVAKAGIDADRTSRSIESLTEKGYIGKTLGKTGGERWYVTEPGRKVLMSPQG